MHSQDMNQWPLAFLGNLSRWRAATTRKEYPPYKYRGSLCSTWEWFKGTAIQTPQCPTQPETCCAKRSSDNRILACSYDDIIQPWEKKAISCDVSSPWHHCNCCVINQFEFKGSWAGSPGPDSKHSACSWKRQKSQEGAWKNICVLYIIHLLTNIFSFRQYYCLSKTQVKKLWC